jgi:hypothetical protein
VNSIRNTIRKTIRKTTLVVLVASLSVLGTATAQAKPGPATLTRPGATASQHRHQVHHVKAAKDANPADDRSYLRRAPRFRFDRIPT